MVDDSVFAISKASKTAKDMGTGRLVYQDNVHLHGPIGLTRAERRPDHGQWRRRERRCQSAQRAGGVHQDRPIRDPSFSVDPTNGGAFGLAIGSRNGVTTLAAVDDVTSQLGCFRCHPGNESTNVDVKARSRR